MVQSCHAAPRAQLMSEPLSWYYEPCEDCSDSGYVTIYRGSVWIKGPMTSVLQYCSCIIGQHVELEAEERTQNDNRFVIAQ